MNRLLISTLFLLLVGFAMAQPIEDYKVVCTTTVETTEVDADGEEVVTSESTETTIGVASNINGEWHVSLDRDAGATCEGDVTLVPQFGTEDGYTAPTIQIEAPDEETPEDAGDTTNGDTESTEEPLDEGEDGDEEDVDGEEDEGGPTIVVTIDEEPPVENVVSVPAVAIAGKERAQRNRNAAWDRRDERREERRGGPDEEPAEPEEEEPEAESEDEPEEDVSENEPETEATEEGEQKASGRPDHAGPPDRAGPPSDDSDVEADEDENENEEEEEDENGRGGPPGDRGNGNGNGNGKAKGRP